MHVVAFAASNSRSSINKQLVSYAVSKLSVSVELLDLNDFDVPIYSIDIEKASGIPTDAQRFLEKIDQADAVVISFAEHNGTYTAAYKNLYDWMSRIKQKVFENKKIILLATSPGPGGARNVLASAIDAMPHFGADVVGAMSVPKFNQHFDQTNQVLNDSELDQQLADLMAQLG